jgi:hypothetical protein
MPFPLFSTLADLDSNTQAIESQLDRLQAGLQVNEEKIVQAFQTACQTAAKLTQQIHAERPDAHWTDRVSLEQLIQELKAAADEKLNQQRRARILDLVNELDSGRVKHRLEARTTVLNKLRSQAVEELRVEGAIPQQTKELPGPAAHEWLVWAFDLDDNKDASTLAALRRDFPAVERFTAEMEESYWIPAHRPADSRDGGSPPQAKPGGGSSASSSTAASSSSKSHSAEATATTKMQASDPAEVLARSYQKPPKQVNESITVEEPVAPRITRTEQEVPVRLESQSPATTPFFDAPKIRDEEKGSNALVAQAVAAEISGSAIVQESAEEDPANETEQPATFFSRLFSRKRSAVAWAGASGFIVLSLLFFSIIYYLHDRNNAKPVPTVEAATAGTDPSAVSDTSTAPVGNVAAATPAKANTPGSLAPASNGKTPLLNQQPAEGPQDSILLNLENCGRGTNGIIECWGYASNLGGGNSRVSLDRVDVVDSRGNSFSLDRKGQFAFPSGQSSYIAPGSRVKFTVSVPDKDLEARTLTLYMDLSNPRSLEYTFRNVPVVE